MASRKQKSVEKHFPKDILLFLLVIVTVSNKPFYSGKKLTGSMVVEFP